MNGAALERVFRAASGRIVAALAVRFRDVEIAEEAFAESCLRAARLWPERGAPDRPDGWLYRVAERIALDLMRRARVREASLAFIGPEPEAEAPEIETAPAIPDERLRLIFICCHPACAPEARAALTLRLVCGLSTAEIARAFLTREATLAQRLVRAKRKIAEARVPFELPAPEFWPGRLEAVLATLEVAYGKAHEDAAGAGAHAGFAAETLHLTRLVTRLLPEAGEAHALAALVHYSEARRPARIDGEGVMVPLSEQDPSLWRRDLVELADEMLGVAARLEPDCERVIRARLQQAWLERRRREDPPPWPRIAELYDRLLAVRDDPLVRLNRAIALAEVAGIGAALAEVEALPADALSAYQPYWAARADLLRRAGRAAEARRAYEAALALGPGPGERRWLEGRLGALATPEAPAPAPPFAPPLAPPPNSAAQARPSSPAATASDASGIRISKTSVTTV